MTSLFTWLSDYIIIIAVVIVLVIVTFLLLIFMPRPKCYFDTNDICKELLLLSKEEQFKKIKEELSTLEGDHIEIYKNNLTSNISTSIPETYELLRSIPNVRQVFLTKLDKKTEVDKHKGSESHVFTNNTIRCVLPIKIPGAKKSGIWVDGETKIFTEGEWTVYDNSREHSMFNKHKRLPLYLLVVDIDRSDHIPIGIATEDIQSKL